MDFQKLILERQSVRKYDARPVKPEDVTLCIEAARLAPSATNSQPWKFIVVTEPELRTEIARATVTKGIPINKFALEAPVLIVIVVEKPRVITRLAGWLKEKDFAWTDLGIASEHICLQAAELGLGTCMIGWFDEKRISGLLGVPSKKRIGMVITLGYAPEGYRLRQKVRRPLTDILYYNKWGSHRV